MRRWPAAVLAAALSAAVMFAASLPEARRAPLHSGGDLHSYVHFGFFGALALLTAWTTRSPNRRAVRCAAVALLGFLTELGEARTFHIELEWLDVVLDAMGAVAGSSLGALTAPLLRVPAPERSADQIAR